jgi:hypothetical protein
MLENSMMPLMIDCFFWMFRQIVCWAKRGAQADYRSFDKLTNAMRSLAEVRTRLIEMRLWTSGVQDYLSRVDPELAYRISKTYPHLMRVKLLKVPSFYWISMCIFVPCTVRKLGSSIRRIKWK